MARTQTPLSGPASQADNEGSIPFTRSTIFKGFRRVSLSLSVEEEVAGPEEQALAANAG